MGVVLNQSVHLEKDSDSFANCGLLVLRINIEKRSLSYQIKYKNINTFIYVYVNIPTYIMQPNLLTSSRRKTMLPILPTKLLKLEVELHLGAPTSGSGPYISHFL